MSSGLIIVEQRMQADDAVKDFEENSDKECLYRTLKWSGLLLVGLADNTVFRFKEEKVAGMARRTLENLDKLVNEANYRFYVSGKLKMKRAEFDKVSGDLRNLREGFLALGMGHDHSYVRNFLPQENAIRIVG